MLSLLKSLFGVPKPAGPTETLQSFGAADTPIATDNVSAVDGGWTIAVDGERSTPLFEVPLGNVESCVLAYRAEIRPDTLAGKAYLELWCRVPGKGEFFSKGLHGTVAGTADWSQVEVPFYLKAGQMADLVKLNIYAEGTGQVHIRSIQLLTTPLA